MNHLTVRVPEGVTSFTDGRHTFGGQHTPIPADRLVVVSEPAAHQLAAMHGFEVVGPASHVADLEPVPSPVPEPKPEPKPKPKPKTGRARRGGGE